MVGKKMRLERDNKFDNNLRMNFTETTHLFGDVPLVNLCICGWAKLIHIPDVPAKSFEVKYYFDLFIRTFVLNTAWQQQIDNRNRKKAFD